MKIDLYYQRQRLSMFYCKQLTLFWRLVRSVQRDA